MKRFIVVALAVCASTLAQAADIQSWQTQNGAKVLFQHAPELNMIDLRVVFAAGSARDANKPGVALFTNRMLDEGAAGKNAQQIAETFDAVGAQYGVGSLRDMAWVSLRSLADDQYFKPAFTQFTEILGSPEFPQASFNRIQMQLLQGVKARQQKPGAIANEAFFEALYADHPYAKPSSGNEESLKAITTVDLRNFYERHYVAKNANIAIVGPLNVDQAKALSDQLSKALLPGEALPVTESPKKATTSGKQAIAFPSSQTTLLFGQLAVARNHPDWVALYVGNHILGGSGLVSRLSEEVREKRGLTYGIYSYFSPMQAQGPFLVSLSTKAEQAEQATELVFSELNKFVNIGPSEAELEAAKQNITGGWPLRVASNSSKVEYLAMMGFYGNRLDYLQWFPQQVEKLTVEDIKKAFQKHLKPSEMVQVVVGPSNGEN